MVARVRGLRTLCALSWCLLLSGFDWPESAQALRRAWRVADASARIALIERISLRVDTEAWLPALQEALRDADPAVRRAAAEAFLRAGGVVSVARASEWLAASEPSWRRVAIRALARHRDAEALEALLRALSDPQPALRAEAAERLPWTIPPRAGALRRAARNGLLARLEDPIPLVRRAVVRALGRLGDPVARTEVAARLGDADRLVRLEVPDALARIGGAASLPPLLAALRSDSVELRIAAAAALGRLGDARGVDALRPLLLQADPRLAVSAAHALGRLPGRPVTTMLLDALFESAARFSSLDPRSNALREALLHRAVLGEADAIREVVERHLRAPSNPQQRRVAATFLEEMGHRVPWVRLTPGPLLEALDAATTPGVRAACLRALGEAEGRDRVSLPLLEGLSAPDAVERRAARHALARWLERTGVEPSVVEPIAEASRATRRETTRRELLLLLGHGGEAAFDHLRPWFDVSRDALREAAVMALAEAGGPPHELIRLIAHHPRGDVRRAAAVALGRAGFATLPEEALSRMASAVPTDRRAWLLALVVHERRRPERRPSVRSRIVATLREVLQVASEEDASLALEGLGALRSRDAVAVLREASERLGAHPVLGPALRRTLGSLGILPPASILPEVLADWLGGMALAPDEPSERVVRFAIERLRAPWPAAQAAAAVLARGAALRLTAEQRKLPCRLLHESEAPVLVANLALWAAHRPGRCGASLATLLGRRLRASRSRLVARSWVDALWALWRAEDASAARPLRRCLVETPAPLLSAGCWPSEEPNEPPASLAAPDGSVPPAPVGWYVVRVGRARVPLRMRPGGRIVPSPSRPPGVLVRLLSLPSEPLPHVANQ